MATITFADIKKANESIKTTDIKNKEYAEVNQRVKAFRMVYPGGCILTDMVSNDNGICVFKATVSDDEGKVIGTGMAFEKESSSYINKTSYIENCETSAVGRALGFCGFGIDTSICSADELTNALANQSAEPKKEAKPKKNPPKSPKAENEANTKPQSGADPIPMHTITPEQKAIILAELNRTLVDPHIICKCYNIASLDDMTQTQFENCKIRLKATKTKAS